jgi:hypothetical protein
MPAIPVAYAGYYALASAAIAAGATVYSSDQQASQAAKSRQAAESASKAVGTAQGTTPADSSAITPTGGSAAAGVNSGPASTLLTGAGGINPKSLNTASGAGLGTNTLLGS